MRAVRFLLVLAHLVAGSLAPAQDPKQLRERHLVDGPRAWARIQEAIDAWAAREPGLVSAVLIGRSLEDRPIRILRLGCAKEGAPEVALTAGIHGNEGSEMDAEGLVELLLSRASVAPFAALLQSRVIWILPVINPDGLVNRTRWNARGVDLNRNFGVDWRAPRTNLAQPDREFPGPEAYSEPETRAVRDFLRSRPALRAFIDIHRSAEMVISPQAAFDAAASDAVKREAVALGAAMGGGWNRPEPLRFDHLHGTIFDWVFGEFGIMAFGWELPFVPPAPPAIDDPRWRGVLHVLERCPGYPAANASTTESAVPAGEESGSSKDEMIDEAELRRLCGERWSGDWWKGRKEGWSHAVRRIEVRGDRRVFVERKQSHRFDPRVPGHWVGETVDQIEHAADPPQAFLRATQWSLGAWKDVRRSCGETVVFSHGDACFQRKSQWTLTANGVLSDPEAVSKRREVDSVEFPLRHSLDFERWLRRLPEARRRRFFPTFSVHSARPESFTEAFERSIPAAPPHRLLMLHECSQHIVARYLHNAEGWFIAAGDDDGFSTRPDSPESARTTFGPDGLPGTLVRVSRPLGRPTDHSELVLDMGARWAPIFDATESQTLEVVDGASTLRLRLMVAPAGSATTDVEHASYLHPSDRIPSDNPDIREAASKRGEGTSDVERVRALLRWVQSRIGNGPLPPGFDAREVLEAGRGDAEARALLFVALARAAGIPARPVPGLVYLGDREQGFGRHWWAEVCLPPGRWIAVDPSRGQMPADLFHIHLRPATPEFLATLAVGERPSFDVP